MNDISIEEWADELAESKLDLIEVLQQYKDLIEENDSMAEKHAEKDIVINNLLKQNERLKKELLK